MEILIIKIGAIGDAVMALGAVQWLRTTYPDARITWLGGEKIVPLLQTTKVIDQIISIKEEALLGPSRIDSLKTLCGIWRKLFGKKFDLIMLGHKDWRYRLLLLSTRRNKTHMFGSNKNRAFPVPGRYHGDEYLRLVSGADDRKMPVFTFPAVILPDLSPLLEKSIGSHGSSRILLIPGSAKNYLADDPLRRWPVHFYVELSRILITKGYKVILGGGKTDFWVKEWFWETGVIDLIGKTSLKDLMSLISCSDVVVAHDSGPLHLAILLQKPLLALFGPTDPNEKLPRQRNYPVRLLWKGKLLPCAPCYDGKKFAQCDRNVCMEMISVSDAEEAIEQLLA